MDKNTISETLKFDFSKIEVIDLYLTHIHKEEITLPNKNWSKIELELFKSSILNSDLLNSFVNLTHLNLTSLNILDYPDISNLKKLKELHHIGGKFTLPISIGECVSLNNIYISCVGFSKLPKSLSMLKNLENLTIENSNLKVIKDIVFLKNLKQLNLRQNKIEKIPDDILNLINLEYLNLQDNKINDLPTQVYDLKNIKELNLSDNPIFNLNISSTDWKFLKILDLSRTPFGCFKQNIDELKKRLPNCDIKGGRNNLFFDNGNKYFFIPSIKRNLSSNDYIPQ
jgi:hypothetical protein